MQKEIKYSPLYKSIEDLPMYNWHKIHEKKDYSFLKIKRVNAKITKEEYHRLKKRWEKIFDEYINKFGFSEQFLSIFEKQKTIAFYKLNRIISGDGSLDTIIEIHERELAEMLSKKDDSDFYSVKASVEKAMKFHLDIHKITVVEFYSYLNNLKKKPE